MIVKPGNLLLGYSGERSQEQAAQQIRRWFEGEGWDVCLYEFDPYFVHADCTLGMLTDNLIAACTDVVTPEVKAWLAGLGIEVLDVPFRYVGDLGINVVSLGQERVLMPKQSDFLADRCRGLGLEVYDPDVSAITMVGGTADPPGPNPAGIAVTVTANAPPPTGTKIRRSYSLPTPVQAGSAGLIRTK